MKKVYTILFEGELSQISSQWIFPFGVKVQRHAKEKLIDVQFSRRDAVGSGLIKDSKKISSEEKKELIQYALYKIKELIDSGEIQTTNKSRAVSDKRYFSTTSSYLESRRFPK